MGLFKRRPTLTEEQLAELRQTAREWINPGFRQREGLAQELVEFRDDLEVFHDVLLEGARRVVDETWRARLAEESTCPTPATSVACSKPSTDWRRGVCCAG